jgi:hypothetical protein
VKLERKRRWAPVMTAGGAAEEEAKTQARRRGRRRRWGGISIEDLEI